EKLRSSLWIKGRAIEYFFIHPKFRKIDISFFVKSQFVSSALTFSMIAIQFLPLFVFLFFPAKFNIPIVFGLIIFSLILIICFHYVGLAELCFIGCLVTLQICLFLWDKNLVLCMVELIEYLNPLQTFLFWFFVLNATIYFLNSSLPTGLISKFSKSSILTAYLLKLPRLLMGILRVGVYSEEHLSSPLAYNFRTKKSEGSLEIFPLYESDGTPKLKNTFFLPTAFLSTSFKIHDILSQLDNEKKISRHYYNYLKGYLKYISRHANFPELPGSIYIWINQLNLRDYVEDRKPVSSRMIPVMEIRVGRNFELDFFGLKTPLLHYKSLRKYGESRLNIG
ncbi:MAG: hypothetical protein VW456_06235, partial [Alphaproteobacteria bacterium]